ncbi:MAG: SDR family oxidoreductase [Vicinamibacterales bacterium]
MDLGLKGKVAMVAGASKGLGYGTAKALAAEGAIVSIASRDKAAIEKAAADIVRETGGLVIPFEADVRSADAITAWMSTVEKSHGGIDMLYANAGGPPAGSALEFHDKDWQDAFELLLLSTIRMCRAVVPSMRRRGGGSIVVATSSSVKEPLPNLALSNVMRGGVSSLAKTLSLELAKDHIRVNQLMPGRIDTDRVRHLDEVNSKKAGITPEEQKTKALAAIPVGRYGNADEFGRAAAFLLSDAASYITGATLQVDGGLIKGVL